MRSRISSQVYQELQLRCQSLAASNNNGFRQEFESLNDVGKEFPTRTGDLEANREKNRYPAILPYDHCRVRLSLQDSQHSDYINASFVPGGCSERDFVCTQGPLCNTIADFWRMVWEQNVRVIVMVTALKHNSVVLCDQYWPLEQGTACFGLFQVSTLERKRGPDYFITTIRLRHWGCPAERVITHYYYPVWPDHGVPKDASSLCVFTEHVRQHLDALPRLGPAVVHCSAGVGRSGTFVSLLWLLQLCVGGIKPDVRAAVEDLRKHRVLMVQNLEQYIFVHQCLLHWLSVRTTGLNSSVHQRRSVPVPAVRAQERPHSSSVRSRHGHRLRQRGNWEPNAPHPAPTQSTMHNLLRRLLPSSMTTNLHSHK
ncbi:receptor-type tyrosine-protein phosphatase V-like isoform X3 [Osmerus mordax]|uniref:receptor-type tyrosine-protein phosphatase V-like isoform X3 n=1 Tax=Osmerus mordax TaxID=8014 RepID=UPI00350FD1A7